MSNLQNVVDSSDIIISEYNQTVEDGGKSFWMDWESDWDHGADWKIMPVFASKKMIETRYQVEMDWENAVKAMEAIWPEIFQIVFSSFPVEKVSLVAFSRLGPHQELRPHSHDNKGHLIFHMGIDIPDGDVGISSSMGSYKWEKSSDWILFDDNKIHSAWNRTPEDRTIFYIDFVP
jgi:hypothetical protein